MTTLDYPPAVDPGKPVPVRPAATVAVLRDGAEGIEVLLLRRAERGDRNSGAWVFPGGLVDAGDRAAHACCADTDDARASATMNLPAGGLDYLIAAVRECFEEAGLLYARAPGRAELVELHGEAADSTARWRQPLHRGERNIGELCQHTGWTLAVDELAYLSHWITPPGLAKRFDTRFFVARAPAVQVSAHDEKEVTEQRWLRPAEALGAGPDLRLMTPTKHTLELLQRFGSVRDVLAYARAQTAVPVTMPMVGRGSQGVRPVLPEEPAYAELSRVDPGCSASHSYEIEPDRPVRLSPRLIRVTADNGSVMTGPGTNAYLVGGGPRNEWAVIDPGPALDAHVQAVLDAAPGPIRWIFATHTHIDHSPACVALAAATGAPVHGMRALHREWQDASFAPQVALQGGERFELDDGVTLRAIHTPGHASNHLCYLLEEEKTLFTGDHVMQLSTVVINPPDGDMAAYLHSLRELTRLDLDWLAPGHGFLMREPRAAIEAVIAHRLKREAKVLRTLREHGPAPVDLLLPRVYDDVPQRMHPVAVRSLRAHLIKLCADGAATEDERGWRAA